MDRGSIPLTSTIKIMKIYTSYFYQIRFFKPYQIPISTAMWDPKWYHDNQNPSYTYIDKNGVINGLRAPIFCLPHELYNEECGRPCRFEPPQCPFMTKYYNYLNTLDFNDIINRCNSICNRVQQLLQFKEEPELILLVHESKSCTCAERPVLQQWFKENNYPITEWAINSVVRASGS